MILSALAAVSALLVFFAAGQGCLCLLSKGEPQEAVGSWAERSALSWLLGVGYVSLALAILGLVLAGAPLIGGVALGAIGLYAYGRMAHRSEPRVAPKVPLTWVEWLLVAILASQFAVVLWTVGAFPLGWDGLTIWDMKAQIAFTNDGRLPQEYFRDGTRSWSHVHYPLYWPYAETWLYLCLGRADQTWVRGLGALFYAAAVALLAGAVPRLGGTRQSGLIAAVCLFFLPMLTAMPFGVFAGYADFPLAALYLAAVCRLPAWPTLAPRVNDRILGALAMLVVWTKTEGKVLLGALLVTSGLVVLRSRQWRRLLVIAAPAILLLIAHSAFLRHVDALKDKNYFPPSPGHILEHADRIVPVLAAFGSQFIQWNTWSLLWPGAALAMVSLWMARKRADALQLAGVLILPMPGYGLAYILSTWPDYERHIYTSLSRLLLGLAPVALLAIGLALAHAWRRLPAR